MATARSSAASIKVLNGSALWITGGVYKEQILPPPTEPVVHLVNTTELIFVNGTAMPGPDLPANLLNHCLVQSGPNKFIFTTVSNLGFFHIHTKTSCCTCRAMWRVHTQILINTIGTMVSGRSMKRRAHSNESMKCAES